MKPKRTVKHIRRMRAPAIKPRPLLRWCRECPILADAMAGGVVCGLEIYPKKFERIAVLNGRVLSK